MTEKNIDSEKREKDLRYFLVVLLLLVICCLEFIHIYKLNKITHKHHWMNRIENMVDKDFKHKKPMDIRSMQQNANKIREDLKNKMQQVQNAQTASAETKQQYDAEKGVFVIEMEIPSNLTAKNIAIEFDGLFWHNDKSGKSNNYHLMKTELCNSKNIHLIHIFEDEWLYKQDIVNAIRTIPERYWDAKNKEWHLSYDSLPVLKEALPNEQFNVQGTPISYYQ